VTVCMWVRACGYVGVNACGCVCMYVYIWVCGCVNVYVCGRVGRRGGGGGIHENSKFKHRCA